MEIIPAVNIMNGHCIKIAAGTYEGAEIYSHSPRKMALQWESQGAGRLHVTDLDGVFAGYLVNEEAIQKLVEAVEIPVEVGGGIRSIQEIEKALTLGADRVVIGTKAVENPKFIQESLNLFGPEHLVVSIAVQNGMVAVDGWSKVSTYNALNLINELTEMGIRYVEYTDISEFGTGSIPNEEMMVEIADMDKIQITVYGNFNNYKDLENAARKGAYGAIVDNALYENRILLPNAIAFFNEDKGRDEQDGVTE